MALLKNLTVAVFSGATGAQSGHRVAMQQSFGRVTDEIASLFGKCFLSLCVAPDDGTKDYVLQSDNIQLIAQPNWAGFFEGLKYPAAILSAGKKVVDASDIIFVRGTVPYLPLIYLYAISQHKPIVHWHAGDLRESLKWYTNAKTLQGRARSAFAWLDEKWFKAVRMCPLIYFVTSGCALYEKYRGPRTTLVVSSTISRREFFRREDTSLHDPVRILFVGFVRPGKGLKYLIEALPMLKTARRFTLAVVGDAQGYEAEKAQIHQRIEELNLADKITWEGYAHFGQELFDQLRRSDLLVLPTLSEGAPHVLIEARAFGLPVVSTKVGGIPSSVKDGIDGLLVPPRDSAALARAIDSVIEHDELRRRLVLSGYDTATRYSLENFIVQIGEVFEKALKLH